MHTFNLRYWMRCTETVAEVNKQLVEIEKKITDVKKRHKEFLNELGLSGI